MKKLILLGGGMDSTTLLVDEVKKNNSIYALFFNYNQKAYDEELKSATYFCKKYKVPLTVVSVEINKLTDSFILKSSKLEESSKANCLEGRNAIFLSMGITYATHLEIKEVLLGFHAPPEGYMFPDAHDGFITAFNKYVDSYLNKEFKGIRASIPYWNLNRYDIFKLAMDLDKEIINKSYSCYEEKKCNKCEHCKQKKEMVKKYEKEKKEMRKYGIRWYR